MFCHSRMSATQRSSAASQAKRVGSAAMSGGLLSAPQGCYPPWSSPCGTGIYEPRFPLTACENDKTRALRK